MRSAVPRLHAGFTLVELMVTVTILAITLGLALPSFRDLMASQRMRSVAYDMTSDLVLARSEAVKRGEPITLTPAAGGWQAGWSVRAPASGTVVANRSGASNGVLFTTAPGTVTFDLNGRLGALTTPVRFELSDGASHNRCISLDPSGRPKSSLSACP